jgi:hypothetical protein
MIFLSASYANPEQTAAIAETDTNGAVLISALDDPQLWAALLSWGTPDPLPIPPVQIPQAVSPLQARKTLRIAGIKEQVEAFIATLSDADREEWEYCIEVRRDNPTIALAATALGLTAEQVDQLFIQAAQL